MPVWTGRNIRRWWRYVHMIALCRSSARQISLLNFNRSVQNFLQRQVLPLHQTPDHLGHRQSARRQFRCPFAGNPHRRQHRWLVAQSFPSHVSYTIFISYTIVNPFRTRYPKLFLAKNFGRCPLKHKHSPPGILTARQSRTPRFLLIDSHELGWQPGADHAPKHFQSLAKF